MLAQKLSPSQYQLGLHLVQVLPQDEALVDDGVRSPGRVGEGSVRSRAQALDGGGEATPQLLHRQFRVGGTEMEQGQDGMPHQVRLIVVVGQGVTQGADELI